MMHENGDEFFRPTNAAWKCKKCGQKLYTVSCIVSHKARCTDNPNVTAPKSEYDTQRERKLSESLNQFKRDYGVN